MVVCSGTSAALARNESNAILVILGEVHKGGQKVLADVLRFQCFCKRCKCLQGHNAAAVQLAVTELLAPVLTCSVAYAMGAKRAQAVTRPSCGQGLQINLLQTTTVADLCCCTPDHGCLIMAQLQEGRTQLRPALLLQARSVSKSCLLSTCPMFPHGRGTVMAGTAQR